MKINFVFVLIKGTYGSLKIPPLKGITYPGKALNFHPLLREGSYQ